MGVYREDIMNIEMTGGSVHRSFLNHQIGEGDGSENRFGVRLFRDGAEENIAGASCVGYFIRPDGITLTIKGTVTGNEAFVELPSAAYAKTGKFTLSIKLIGSGATGTIRIVDGEIIDTTTGSISDDAELIPGLEDLEEIAERAEAAVDEINALSISVTKITGSRYKINITKE